MKVVILVGGKGSRISQYTQKIPKPMIRVGNIPMLTHIMRFFKFYGFNEFIIAGGYKINIIKKYYKNSKEFKSLKIQILMELFLGEGVSKSLNSI